MMPRVGIVGLGRTGTQAARRLLAAEPETVLTLYDVRAERCEPFRGQATLASAAAEVLCESDAIVLALPGEHEIDRTLERFSDGRVAAPVAGKLVLDLSALGEDAAQRLGAALAAAGAGYARARLDTGDAPLLAGTHADPDLSVTLLRMLTGVTPAAGRSGA